MDNTANFCLFSQLLSEYKGSLNTTLASPKLKTLSSSASWVKPRKYLQLLWEILVENKKAHVKADAMLRPVNLNQFMPRNRERGTCW